MSPLSRRSRRVLSNVVVALPLALGVGVFAWTRAFPGQFRALAAADLVSVRTGAPVPIVELRDTAGEAVSLPSLVGPRGALVLVVDPASPNSVSQVVALAEVLRGDRAEGVSVVLVSVGEAEAARELGKRHPALPVYDDAGGAFGARYGLRGTPVLLVADGERRVRAVHGGRLGLDELRQVLRAARGS